MKIMEMTYKPSHVQRYLILSFGYTSVAYVEKKQDFLLRKKNWESITCPEIERIREINATTV